MKISYESEQKNTIMFKTKGDVNIKFPTFNGSRPYQCQIEMIEVINTNNLIYYLLLNFE